MELAALYRVALGYLSTGDPERAITVSTMLVFGSLRFIPMLF